MATRKNRPDDPESLIEEKNLGAVYYEDRYRGDVWGMLVPLKQGVKCENCQNTVGIVYIVGPHFRLDCYSGCQRFIKFIPKTPWLRDQLEDLGSEYQQILQGIRLC